MVESIRVKAEGFVFSVKKRIALSEFIPSLKLSQESLFTIAKIGSSPDPRKDTEI
jgi:hypothetical protein